jgi:hypothetical protein
MYDAEWPMRQASLLFGGLALGQPDYIALWKTLPADSSVEEVVRNFFIRQPVLWIEPTSRGVSGGEPTASSRSVGSPPEIKTRRHR